MSKTNCKNCGGPLDIAQPKCQFCGTRNINLTDIDLASGEAANFIFRLPHITGADGKEVYMSCLAIPELKAMEMTSNDVVATGGWGCVPIVSWSRGSTLDINLNLRVVPRKNSNEIARLTYD